MTTPRMYSEILALCKSASPDSWRYSAQGNRIETCSVNLSTVDAPEKGRAEARQPREEADASTRVCQPGGLVESGGIGGSIRVQLSQGLIQCNQALQAGVPHSAGGELGDPGRRQGATCCGSDLLPRGGRGVQPVPERFDESADIHETDSSTRVLKKQRQSSCALPHPYGMTDKSRINVAQNVRRLRQLRGWTQSVLAEKAKVAQTVISYLERVDSKSPTLETLQAVADAFSIPVWTLLLASEDIRPETLNALDHVVQTFGNLPTEGQMQIQRTADAEERYARSA
jgi:transcriptional regulator with XRE-family HTH domain